MVYRLCGNAMLRAEYSGSRLLRLPAPPTMSCFYRPLFAALCVFTALTMAVNVGATPRKKTAPKERVVMQVTDSDPKRWNQILTTAKQLKAELGEGKIDIVVIAIGPGVNMLKEGSDVANRIENAIARKISLIACGASMKALNLDEDDMVDSVHVVPSGAAEIIKRQRAGWAYLRI